MKPYPVKLTVKSFGYDSAPQFSNSQGNHPVKDNIVIKTNLKALTVKRETPVLPG